ncbi:cyclopropane-fatty-acyl-phospholipid synthase family protein [Amycolatopsis acididurans]|uniref:cyclopropane-fatty-acyl-phospholipid synthase family protein n=1 Tax=Amycolatopsis acididurans TaxID=2724524 RepID=UPI0028A741C7|nr:cyclopropane-fatty-acyl-phospholipid synthase family protein [Amycolatopsis acididurans]
MPDVAPQLAALLSRLIGGELPVGLRAWDGSTAGQDTGPKVVLSSRRALRRLLWNPGELGLARAYVSGDLDVEGDLTEGLRRCWNLFRSGKLRRPQLGASEWAEIVRLAVRLGVLGPRPAPPPEEARPTGRLHTRLRDRAVIAHHYDLGNDFYQLVLDETMAYSCAYFTDPAQSLADAQRAKLDLVCRRLGLRPGMRFLDVGCGWGSLLLHAAEHYGVVATGITLSEQQAAHVRAEITERDLPAEVLLLDYRDLDDEPYDAIASLEMGEHVGAGNYPRYASTLFRMLRPGGRLLLQQMSRGEVAPGGGAFIESYIAPDMTMVPIGETLSRLETAGFEIREVRAMREHYVPTVRAWAENLEKNADQVPPGWLRVWRLYLAGGALAFEENRMGVNQILAAKTTVDGRA